MIGLIAPTSTLSAALPTASSDKTSTREEVAAMAPAVPKNMHSVIHPVGLSHPDIDIPLAIARRAAAPARLRAKLIPI